MRKFLIVVAVLLGMVIGGVAAVMMAVPPAASASPAAKPPPAFVFWFTAIPKRLEPMECQAVPQFSRLFQGLPVRVCVPYFLNGYPAPGGQLPAPQRITRP